MDTHRARGMPRELWGRAVSLWRTHRVIFGLVGAAYSVVCFCGATYVNNRLTEAKCEVLENAARTSPGTATGSGQILVEVKPDRVIATIMPYQIPYERITSPSRRRDLHFYYLVSAAYLFVVQFLLFVSPVRRFRQPHAYGLIIFVVFSLVALAVPYSYKLFRLTDVVVATSFAYAALTAIIYSTEVYDPLPAGVDLRSIRPEAIKALSDHYSLLLRTGLFVFGAFCLGLMWQISKEISERYKEAAQVYAQLEALTNTQIAIHAALFGIGLLVGVLSSLFVKVVRLIRVAV